MPVLKHEYDALDGLLTLALEIEYDATPYVPAKINADPDDCYPESGGITVNEVRVLGVTVEDVDLQVAELIDAVCEYLDDLEETAKADHEAALEADWEERRADERGGQSCGIF